GALSMAIPNTSRDHHTLQEHPMVTELLAELQAIEERRLWAVRLHTLMHQHGPLEIPVQYERLFLHSPDRQRSTHMTIREALTTARAGGYHINGSDGMATDYGGANSEYSVWTRKNNGSSFIVPVAETFLDPHFWQALGRKLGWEEEVRTVHTVEHGRATLVTRAGYPWLSHWHRFIDHLAVGNTPAAFFAPLLSSQTGESKEPTRTQRRPSVLQATKRTRVAKRTKRGR